MSPRRPSLFVGAAESATLRFRAGGGRGYRARMTDANAARVVLSDEARAQILNAEVARYAQSGWTVQSVNAGQAVLSKLRRMGWFWNTVGVFITAGLWLIYVIYRALNRKRDTLIITVDAYGQVRTQG